MESVSRPSGKPLGNERENYGPWSGNTRSHEHTGECATQQKEANEHQRGTQVSASAKGAARGPRGQRRRHHRQKTANRPHMASAGSMLADSATALGHVRRQESWLVAASAETDTAHVYR